MSEPLSPPPVPPPPGEPGAGGGLPWEERERHGAVNAFIETMRRLVTEPVRAFATARRSGELVSPLAYAVLVGWIGVLAERLWSLTVGTSLLQYLPPEVREGAAWAFAFSGFGIAIALLLAPILILISLMVWGAIVHLFLMLYGATRQSETGFEGTVRALAWSSTAQLGQIVPFAGGLVAMVWSIVLQTVGLAELHRTTQGRALAAVLSPLLLCCVCLGVSFAGVLAMIAGAAAGR